MYRCQHCRGRLVAKKCHLCEVVRGLPRRVVVDAARRALPSSPITTVSIDQVDAAIAEHLETKGVSRG